MIVFEVSNPSTKIKTNLGKKLNENDCFWTPCMFLTHAKLLLEYAKLKVARTFLNYILPPQKNHFNCIILHNITCEAVKLTWASRMSGGPRCTRGPRCRTPAAGPRTHTRSTGCSRWSEGSSQTLQDTGSQSSLRLLSLLKLKFYENI